MTTIKIITGNFGASGLRLREMAATGNSGIFVPINEKIQVVQPGEIGQDRVDKVVKKYVAPVKPDGFIIGMAGPVINGIGDMTWLNATLSEAELTQAAETQSNQNK